MVADASEARKSLILSGVVTARTGSREPPSFPLPLLLPSLTFLDDAPPHGSLLRLPVPPIHGDGKEGNRERQKTTKQKLLTLAEGELAYK